jgi:hypothetical protein
MSTVPKLTLRAATEHRMPARGDSNSPYPWRGDCFVIFLSAGHLFRSKRKSLYSSCVRAGRCSSSLMILPSSSTTTRSASCASRSS